jgi:predicted phosphodiesterase
MHTRLLNHWLGLALLLAVPNPVPASAAAPLTPPVITTGPVLQCPMETSMTVTWITDRKTTAAVEYGPLQGTLKTAVASHHGLVDGNERTHKVTLENLEPGTVYRYRVISREIVNLRHYRVDHGEAITNVFQEFRTLDRRKQGYDFLVFNDVHGQATNIPNLLQAAGPKPYDFVIFNGDILSFVTNETQISAILNQAVASFASTTALYWVRGNHETRGDLAPQLPAYLGLPGDRYYYSFDHGPVHFIVLDGGEDKIDEHREYGGRADFFRYRREQGEWLKQEVRSKAFRRSKYQVVICHMPFPSKQAADPKRTKEPGAFLGMPDAFEQFGATLEKAGVDLMISGHMHVPAIVPPERGRHSYPIVQGGGDKGTNRTIIRVAVDQAGLSANILRVNGSSFGQCRVPTRR